MILFEFCKSIDFFHFLVKNGILQWWNLDKSLNPNIFKKGTVPLNIPTPAPLHEELLLIRIGVDGGMSTGLWNLAPPACSESSPWSILSFPNIEEILKFVSNSTPEFSIQMELRARIRL